MTTTIVPPAEGRAVDVAAGQSIRIATPHGQQAADFFAYSAEDLSEWLSPMHTWVTTRSVKPRPGDRFLSRFRRPMLSLVDDTAQGCHDMLIAACDQKRYEQFGFEGHHRSCSENLAIAMNGRGHPIVVTPQPVNFFTNTLIDPDGQLLSPPNPVAPGSYVEMEALMDVICIVSSCPFDLKIEGWSINAQSGPSELEVSVL